MARIRMLSAGLGGSSKYNVNPWGNQGGGNKKQGLPPIRNKSVEFISRSIKIRAWGNPEQRRKVFFINQTDREVYMKNNLVKLLVSGW